MSQKLKHFKQLTNLYGIGVSTVKKIYYNVGININTPPLKVKMSQKKSIFFFLKFRKIETKLKLRLQQHIEFLQSIKTFKYRITSKFHKLENERKTVKK